MRKSRFAEEQIIAALKEHSTVTPAKEPCRWLGAYGGKREAGRGRVETCTE